MASLHWDKIQKGFELPAIKKPAITTKQLVMYAGASKDFNPIHYDQKFAEQAGLPGVIAHGMLTMGFLGQLVTDWIYPGATLKKLSTRFKAITYPGDEITCAGVVVEKSEDNGQRVLEIDLEAKNQKGEVTATGRAVVMLP